MEKANKTMMFFLVLGMIVGSFLSGNVVEAARSLKSEERIVPQTFFGSPPGYTATYSAPGMMGGGIGIGSISSSPICSYPGVTCTPIQMPTVPLTPPTGGLGGLGGGSIGTGSP